MGAPSPFDVLVVGGGLAGLRAAMEAQDRGARVAVLTKVMAIRSHSGAAQGGVNAALGNHPDGEDDTWERHAFDTIKGSDYLADQPRAEILAREAPERVLEMERWGTGFSRLEDGRIAQRPFGGAGYPRTCFAADRTGHHLLHTLWEQCLARDLVSLNEWLVLRIAMVDGRAVGVVAHHIPTGVLQAFDAGALVLAGGGHGRIYDRSTNALINTGSLTAAAYTAGAPLQDMEFVQFHPTTLYGTNILMSEGVRGEGGVLVNARGERFMERYAPGMRDLAPRDIVARSIQTELDEGRGFPGPRGGYVELDVRHLGASLIQERLPGIRQIAMDFTGVDPVDQPIPVQPGQHYSMGGLACDEEGRTPLPGLLAAGECSCISVHGANRLGGNSLLETLVFGRRAGLAAAVDAGDGPDPARARQACLAALAQERERLATIRGRTTGPRQGELRARMKATLTEKVGVFRTRTSLAEAVADVEDLAQRYRSVRLDGSTERFNYDLVDTLELGGMVELARVTAATALEREECRGSHWRLDHPERNDERWLCHSRAAFDPAGPPRLGTRDVEITAYPPQERTY